MALKGNADGRGIAPRVAAGPKGEGPQWEGAPDSASFAHGKNAGRLRFRPVP